MNLNKKELKLISYDFRCISNRLLNATYYEMESVLNMFINCIESTPIIYDYVNSCDIGVFDTEKEVNEVREAYGNAIFELGVTIEEETARIYSILKYISENKIDISIIARAYARGSKSYNEYTKGFNNRISLILINHISDYLTKISINMGYDEEVKYMITVNGGQVNISKDNSTLNATQNIGVNSDELGKMITSIKSLIDQDISNDDKELIEESVETIQSELQNGEPKKAIVKSCLRGLKLAITNIPTAIELCNNIEQFINYVTTFIK
ncbi:hypothetical protein [Clostridium tertium]|nr:hypothetical protein [Clostridium tertium]